MENIEDNVHAIWVLKKQKIAEQSGAICDKKIIDNIVNINMVGTYFLEDIFFSIRDAIVSRSKGVSSAIPGLTMFK